MIRSFLFQARLVIAWYLLFLVLFVVADWIWSLLGNVVVLLGLVTIIFVVIRAHSHLGRVRMLNGGKLSGAALANRQRRQIEMPLEAGDAFDLLDAAIRELPGAEAIDSARDSLQVRAMAAYPDPYGSKSLGRFDPMGWIGSRATRVLATVTPRRRRQQCHPDLRAGERAWSDWFRVDDGTNLENAEAIARAITRRVAERRRGEQAAAAQTATEKELTVAKLTLLHAQVEPHFLYNTLASAQFLDAQRSGARRRDARPPHPYLRHSLPRTEDALSTLGEELERARAYLEILKIRMGARLNAADRRARRAAGDALPADDAADAGRERDQARPGAATGRRHGVDPRAPQRCAVAVTVADDGHGFSDAGQRHRHRPEERARTPALAYGAAATLVIVANFPQRRRRHDHRARRRDRRVSAMAKALVAEDEALLRDALVAALAKAWPELEIVAECEDGGSALEAIAEHQPDVAFLDIRMPGLTGLEVAAAGAQASPATQIVFVTAYDQYAIDAFERGAVDYLLKPIDAERLAATVQRVQARAAAGPADAAALAALIGQLGLRPSAARSEPPLTWITASSGARRA